MYPKWMARWHDMAKIEERLKERGLILPAPMKIPAGLRMPFAWVKVRGNRAYVSGHIALNADGSIAEPLGKVGAEVTPEQGYESAVPGGARPPR